MPRPAAVPARPVAAVPGPEPAATPALPGAGPAWFPVVMGTGILATLLALQAPHGTAGTVATGAARTLTVAAWAVVAGLTTAFLVRCRRAPGLLRETITGPDQRGPWGTVSMGLLSAGAAAVATAPAGPLAQAALRVDVVAWTLATALGFAVALVFAVDLVVRDLGRPVPAWGLPVVPPMVSATTGCTLAAHIASPGGQALLLVLVAACFGTSLLLGGLVFAVAYHHHARTETLPRALWPTLWIPLGMVGQSTAAAQVMAERAARLVDPKAAEALLSVARWYGVVVLGILGAVLAAYAAWWTIRGAIERMPFTPGWWSMTFPVGTCALGAFHLGRVHADAAWTLDGHVITGVLVGTWTLCVVATLRCALFPAMARRQAHRPRQPSISR